MPYYTQDGIRHESQEEALQHTKDFLLTRLPSTEDEFVQAIHSHDWGRFHVQCTPNEGVLYAELAEPTSSVCEESGRVGGGLSLLKYSHQLVGTETKEDLIELMEADKRFISMVGYEVRNLLDELADDDNYFYDDKAHDVVVEYSSYVNNDIFDSEIFYSIEDVFEGVVPYEEGVNNLEAVLNHVRSQFIKEVEGQYDNIEGKINGFDMFTIVDNAARDGKNVKISVSEHRVEEA